MPAGARGIVVHVWADGLAYAVEFETPQHAVLTVEEADLKVVGRMPEGTQRSNASYTVAPR